MKKIFKLAKMFLVMMMAFLLSACAALTPSKQMISVTSNIPDASILINGENVGMGAVKTHVKRDKTVNIMALKDGYHPAYRTIDKHNNIGAILDAAVCGFGLIVFAIPWCISAFAAPGAWSLDETNISVFLIPNSQSNNQKYYKTTEQKNSFQDVNSSISPEIKAYMNVQ